MPRLLFALLMLLVTAIPSFAQETDPEVNGKKLSGWLQDIQSEQNPRLRRVAVASLGELVQAKRNDPTITRAVATSVGKALRNDAALSVRLQSVEVMGYVAEIALEEKNNDPLSVCIDLSESLRVEKDLDLQRKVAALLGRFRKFGKPAVTPLTDCLKSKDAALRQTAADALGRIGEEGRPATSELLKLLKDIEKTVRTSAAFALGRVEPEDVNQVAVALASLVKLDPEPTVRLEAVTSLGLLNDRTAPVLKDMAFGLTDSNADVRRRAAQAFFRLRTAAKVVEAALKVAATQDGDSRVRIDCVRTLVGAYADDPKEVIPFLTGRLDAGVEKDYEVRVVVAEELGGLGLDGVPALPSLRKAQTDPQIKVREAAGRAISSITKSSAPPKK